MHATSMFVVDLLQALQAVLAKLLEGLVEEGLGVQSIEVLSSRRADNLSVQGQVFPLSL